MKTVLIIIVLLCASCSQRVLTPDQYKAHENKKFVRKNITQTRFWPIWSAAMFILIAPNVDLIEQTFFKK